ncbi:YbjN domain-containing protein [Devosia enhydra]|nr:YbjN domain-containing protein [Devosia enhydra]
MASVALLLASIALPSSVQAQAAGEQIIDGGAVDTVLAIAQRHGDATREHQMNGNPGISGRMADTDYYIYFVNCDSEGVCEDINFYAGFSESQPTLESINEWNRDRRFGKAYIDYEDDAVIEMDINLEYGVTADNLDAGFLVWETVLTEFRTHIGYE